MVASAMLSFAMALPASAALERWQPAGLVTTSASLPAVLARLPASSGKGSRVERVRILAPPQAATATVAVRNLAYRVTVDLDGAAFGYGITDDIPWRLLPSGLAHVVRSDMQSDELDRWPHAVYGFDPADCTIVGQTRDPQPLVVVRHAPPLAPPHWFFIDPTSGEVVREVQRDGIQVATFTFSDWRDSLGIRRPFRWHIEGGGPAADVIVDSVSAAPLSEADISPPLSEHDEYFLAPPHPVVLPSRFNRGEIQIALHVNGRAEEFSLDDGTTEITMSAKAAAYAHLAVRFGHAIAPSIDVNGVTMHDVPVLVVPDIFGLDGLLGNDFFPGHIVHVNYQTNTVEVLARQTFVAPPKAVAVPIDVVEGLPLVRAQIGSLTGDRFALDLGSQDVLLSALFFEQAAPSYHATGFVRWLGPGRDMNFLEGPVSARAGTFDDLIFAGVSFAGPNDFRVERSAADRLALPLDGIFGTTVLQNFELWFDYTGGMLYARLF